MNPLYSDGSKPYKYPYNHDPQEKKYYSFAYRPATWSAGLEVVQGVDVLIPLISHGLLHECVSGGITGSTEPPWATTEDEFTTDNTAKFQAKPLVLMLATGDTITASTWSHDVGVIIDNESIVNDIVTKFRLTGVPIDAKSITITNQVSVLRSSGDEEEFERSIIIPIKTL